MGSKGSKKKAVPAQFEGNEMFPKKEFVEQANNIEFFYFPRSLVQELLKQGNEGGHPSYIIAKAIYDDKFRKRCIETYQKEYKTLTGKRYIPYREIWKARQFGCKNPSDDLRQIIGVPSGPIIGLKGNRDKKNF